MNQEPLIKFRPYQKRARAMKAGIAGIIARRQSGKSHFLGTRGIELMMIPVNGKPADVLFMSAALRLGMENIRKEAMIWREVTDKMRKMVHAKGAFKITTAADNDSGQLLDVDAIADLFEHQKLETRIFHDNGNSYARSVVMAPNPDTAVGWTGHTFMDEVGRMPDFQACFEAAEPFVSSNPDFILRMVTTPPPDDTHASYEMLSPRSDEEFPVSDKGNFYRSEKNILILRVDAWDAAAAGVPLYDSETRKPVTPEEHRAKSVDKTAWDRNYGCKFIKGGSAAISKTDLDHACTQGAGQCVGVKVTEQLKLAA
jgi:hypothetical protein